MTANGTSNSNLKPGESIIISESNGITCTMEMSSNGKELRYVRTFPDGSFEVYHKEIISY